MIRNRLSYFLCVAVASSVLLPLAAIAQQLDQEHSRIGFELTTRWGQAIAGHFRQYDGEAVQLPDGRREVRIRLATGSVEVEGSRRYTRFARGESFLDAERHPWLEFHSDPYPPELLRHGGPLQGTLTMRGISRRETFVLAASECSRPGRDCDVVADGHVLRTDYGLESWRWALTDDVHFRLRVRLRDANP